MLKEKLKMTQTIEVITHLIPQKEITEKTLQKIREYRISNPILWDKIIKMFQKT